MFRTSINSFERFAEVTADVQARARAGLNAAAREAAAVAQANASIDLELEVVPAHEQADGYTAGIKSRRTTSTEGRETPLATIFDKGTLGSRRGPLAKRTRRKETWQVKRGGKSHTAHRHPIKPGSGIKAERFFGKARAAGRRALLETIFKP